MLLALVVTTPVAAQSQSQPRTFVDALDTTSAAAVLTTFADAYRHSDYLAVYYLLTPAAQVGFRSTLSSQFSYSVLLPEVVGLDLPGAAFSDPEASEDRRDVISTDPALLFDDVMWAADRADKLPFTLGPGAEISAAELPDGAVAVIQTDGEPAELIFTLRPLDTGNWKIDQISWEGSSRELRPWGVELK